MKLLRDVGWMHKTMLWFGAFYCIFAQMMLNNLCTGTGLPKDQNQFVFLEASFHCSCIFQALFKWFWCFLYYLTEWFYWQLISSIIYRSRMKLCDTGYNLSVIHALGIAFLRWVSLFGIGHRLAWKLNFKTIMLLLI